MYNTHMEQLIDYLQALGGIAVLPLAFFTLSNWRIIRRELRPNSGESVYDRITDIDKRLVRVETRLEEK